MKSGGSMPLADHKTKIVATIGPASESPEMLQRLVRAGLDVARLNFSHGDFEPRPAHRTIRARGPRRRRRLAIMADLPGPKMRLGKIDPEPILVQLRRHLYVDQRGRGRRSAAAGSTSSSGCREVVKPGDRLYVNDGLVQLVVEGVAGNDVRCKVAVGGELGSRKGLNLPGIDLGIGAFTDHDRECLEFALEHGVDAVSQSFVETAADIEAVRAAAKAAGRQPFVIAKIERAGALRHLDDILKAADGIMVARGDLGVEVPIQEMPLTQKRLIAMANLAGKPVITATQMLESMVSSRLPTRAEATDVANAILDGTDCLMLSAESAVGKYPEEAVAMLAKIAAATESGRPLTRLNELREVRRATKAVHRRRGHRAGRRAPALETAPMRGDRGADPHGQDRAHGLPFQAAGVDCRGQRRPGRLPRAGVFLRCAERRVGRRPGRWRCFPKSWLRGQQLSGGTAMLVAGPSPRHPQANYRIEFMRLAETT